MRLLVNIITLIFMSFVFLFLHAVHATVQPFQYVQSTEHTSNYTFYVSQNDTGAWYYSVKTDHKLFIVQKNIPTINGDIAFSDSIQAASVARLVTEKLKNGIFPPSVKLTELDSLKINY